MKKDLFHEFIEACDKTRSIYENYLGNKDKVNEELRTKGFKRFA